MLEHWEKNKNNNNFHCYSLYAVWQISFLCNSTNSYTESIYDSNYPKTPMVFSKNLIEYTSARSRTISIFILFTRFFLLLRMYFFLLLNCIYPFGYWIWSSLLVYAIQIWYRLQCPSFASIHFNAHGTKVACMVNGKQNRRCSISTFKLKATI